VRILYFDRSGYCVWAKRLEQGRFHSEPVRGEKQRLSWTELQCILEGIDTRAVRRFKRFSLPLQRAHGVS
jgi:transposase